MKAFRTTATALSALAALALWAAPATAQSTLLDVEQSDGTDVLTVFDDAGLVVLGETFTGAIPVEGAGTRMMWHPSKAAFRAGQVSGTQWDDVNLGLRSVAFGFDAEASGSHSTAMGRFTTASGSDATAMGRNTTASGNRSTAMGVGTTAGRRASTAMGENTEASGFASTAMGHGTTASGDTSTAMGHGTIASGIDAMAMGEGTTASGAGSTAMGFQTTASGVGSTTMGFQTTASANTSTAMGLRTTASGDWSTAMGSHASTNGREGTFVYGDRSTTTDLQATADDQFVVRAQHFWLGRDANNVSNPTGEFLTTSTGAHLSDGGAWTDASSRASKENLRAVDPGTVLEKVTQLPVQRWNYRAESPEVEHLGPMAEDFQAAFELGADDRHIAPLDVGGVSLVAIQALEERTREQEQQLQAQAETIEALRSENAEQQAENRDLRSENTDQAERIEELSDRVRRLEAVVEQVIESEGWEMPQG